MTTYQQPSKKNSTALIISLIVFGFIIYLPVWINIYNTPFYLFIHGFLVFGLLKLKSFKSTLKPLHFGMLISGTPFLLLFLIYFIITLSYISYGIDWKNISNILIHLGLTLAVCLIDFRITYYFYESWRTKNKDIE